MERLVAIATFSGDFGVASVAVPHLRRIFTMMRPRRGDISYRREGVALSVLDSFFSAMDQGRYPEATSVLEWITQRQPERSSAWRQLARCYAQLGRLEEAARAREQANQYGATPP